MTTAQIKPTRGRPKSRPEGRVNLQVVNMPPALLRRLDIQAATEGRHKYLLVIEALEAYLGRTQA